jgi:hypothetical protein
MAARRRVNKGITVAILVSLATGCSTSAAIERTDGTTLVGKIEGSDQDRLYVSPSEGEHYAVDRTSIARIDHPGRGGMILGTIPIGIGVGFLAVSPLLRSNCGDHDTSPSPCWNLQAMAVATGLSYLLVGLPILLVSYVHNHRSKQAATPAPAGIRPLVPTSSPSDLAPRLQVH